MCYEHAYITCYAHRKRHSSCNTKRGSPLRATAFHQNPILPLLPFNQSILPLSLSPNSVQIRRSRDMSSMHCTLLVLCCVGATAFAPPGLANSLLQGPGLARQTHSSKELHKPAAVSVSLFEEGGQGNAATASPESASAPNAKQSPVFWSVRQQAAAIRDGKLKSRELVDLFIGRIEALDEKVNAVVTRNFEAARKAADEADAAVSRGEAFGALHGVPMTVKDALNTAGLLSTGGATELREHIPSEDAPAIATLRKEGAIVLGKTNVPRFSTDYQSYNAVFGTTNNPWDVARVPGGSSGGAAAAVASVFSSFDVGSDMGGSIRGPAGWCGVFGHKPSFGLIDNTGYLDHPGAAVNPYAGADMNVVGPIARSGEDLDLIFRLLLRRPGFDITLPEPPASLEGLRVATWFDDDFCRVEKEVVALLERAGAELSAKGLDVSAAQPEVGLEEASECGRMLCRLALQPLAPTSAYTHKEWLELDRRRHKIRARWALFFERYDVLLMPVTCTPAHAHDQDGTMLDRSLTIDGESRPLFDVVRWNLLASMAYLPSTAAPIGFTKSNLPVGVQVVSRFGNDLTTIRVASLLSELTQGYQVPTDFR